MVGVCLTGAPACVLPLPRPDPPDPGCGLGAGVQLGDDAPDQLCGRREPLPGAGQHGAPKAGRHSPPGQPPALDPRPPIPPASRLLPQTPDPSGLSLGATRWPDHRSDRVRLIAQKLPLVFCPLIRPHICHMGAHSLWSAPFPCLSQSTKAIVEPNRTTAEFEVPRLALGDSGLWECRVSTSGGQDSRRFRVNVKGQ